MTRFALLNNVEHKDLRIRTERSAELGDAVMCALAFPFEFRSLQAHYPILLQQDGEGSLCPVALFGFQKGENLFLTDKGWSASYIPAMMRKEPFLIGFQRKDAEEDKRILSIDLDHPRVSADQGEPLFQPLGGRTPYLEKMADLLESLYGGYQQAKTFMAALARHELTETLNFDITLNDGSRNQLIGFYGINEERVQQLDAAALGNLAEEGALMPLFMMLASLGSIGRLVEFKNRALA